MSRRLSSVDVAFETIRREKADGGGRLVDLRIDFELDGELLYTCGGIWDRRLDDFDGEAENGVLVEIHPGQRAAVEWFVSWMLAHADRRDSPPQLTLDDLENFELDTRPENSYAALFAGGRRGGKTWIAMALAVAYAIQFPNAIVWLGAPNAEKFDEIRRYVGNLLVHEWIDHETIEHGWDLCNGSSLLLKSVYNPDLLKEGKAHLVVLNEGQMMKPRAYTVARGAIVDSSGLVLVCANPPVEAKDEGWVDDFAADASLGKRAGVFVPFDPRLNPHIDRASLMAMRHELDDRSFKIEVLGMFLPPKDRVAYNWIRIENERPVADPRLAAALGTPELVDVTAEFVASLGDGIGVKQVAGLDVQRFPWIGGPLYRFFVPWGVKPTVDTVIVWAFDEVVLEGGDELDYCEGLHGKGYDAASTLIICDATAEYQHSRRRLTDEKPPEWTGRGSFDIIRSAGYWMIQPPDRKMRRKNPAIVDRLRAFTSLISSESGRRRLFADPDKCPVTCKSIREWKTVHGQPSRTQEAAHVGDGASYPIIRFFPRRMRDGLQVGTSSINRRPVTDPMTASIERKAATTAVEPDLRVVPHPTRGVSPRDGRGRGGRTRGL